MSEINIIKDVLRPDTQQSRQNLGASSMSEIKAPTSRLLALPAELRVQIYHLAIVKPEGIVVNSNIISEPSLLATCSQIRTEALPIFFNENNFIIDVSNFDSTAALVLFHKFEIYNSSRAQMEDEFRGTCRPNWTNLKTWLYRVHQYPEMLVAASISSGARSEAAILGMFDAAEQLRDLPWERVEPLVEAIHKTLVTIDQRWAS